MNTHTHTQRERDTHQRRIDDDSSATFLHTPCPSAMQGAAFHAACSARQTDRRCVCVMDAQACGEPQGVALVHGPVHACVRVPALQKKTKERDGEGVLVETTVERKDSAGWVLSSSAAP